MPKRTFTAGGKADEIMAADKFAARFKQTTDIEMMVLDLRGKRDRDEATPEDLRALEYAESEWVAFKERIEHSNANPPPRRRKR